jgi:NADPH:quinone reductase-like Zn-dependent oxidoreductase
VILFNTINLIKGMVVSLNPNDISVRKYKSMLWNTVKDIPEIVGCDIVGMEQELILKLE